MLSNKSSGFHDANDEAERVPGVAQVVSRPWQRAAPKGPRRVAVGSRARARADPRRAHDQRGKRTPGGLRKATHNIEAELFENLLIEISFFPWVLGTRGVSE